MSTDETREALTAMVREGEAAGMYADDHGAAGFCTDHGQPALAAAPSETGWVHNGRGWFEPHVAAPDLSREFRQPGTGNRTAPCLACGTGEAVTLPDSAPEDWPTFFTDSETEAVPDER